MANFFSTVTLKFKIIKKKISAVLITPSVLPLHFLHSPLVLSYLCNLFTILLVRNYDAV